MILFEPSDQHLKLEYPELETIEEFAQLTQGELLFVWYMGSPSSPYAKVKDLAEKVNLCVEKSYGTRLSVTELLQYEKGVFPNKIEVAIDRMKRFSVDTRKRAKNMVDEIFDTFELIISNTPDDIAVNPERQQKYIDNAAKILDNLPALIKKKEEGFGYKTRKKGEKQGASLMDIAMEQEDE